MTQLKIQRRLAKVLLNKLPCLDQGYVALISSSNDSKRLRDFLPKVSSQSLSRELDICSMTLLVRCPLFVQLHLSHYNLTILGTTLEESMAGFVPNEAEIKADDLQTSIAISDDIKRTTEALIINPKAYQSDGCDRFLSQVITPINIYTTILVHGSRRTWVEFINQNKLPYPIESYRQLVKQIHDAEWSDGATKGQEDQA